jgi:hypothetical protein
MQRGLGHGQIVDNMRRVRLVNLALGDPDDVEIYAAAAVWDWTQKPQGKRVVEEFGITTDQMYWTQGTMHSHSITVDIWSDVDEQTEILLKLSGLCQL